MAVLDFLLAALIGAVLLCGIVLVVVFTIGAVISMIKGKL